MLSRLALKHLFCTQSTLILHHCRQVAVCLPPTDKRLDVHLRCVGRRRRCPWPQHRHDTGRALSPISGEACSVAQRTGARVFAAVARHVGDWRAQRAEAIFARGGGRNFWIRPSPPCLGLARNAQGRQEASRRLQWPSSGREWHVCGEAHRERRSWRFGIRDGHAV